MLPMVAVFGGMTVAAAGTRQVVFELDDPNGGRIELDSILSAEQELITFYPEGEGAEPFELLMYIYTVSINANMVLIPASPNATERITSLFLHIDDGSFETYVFNTPGYYTVSGEISRGIGVRTISVSRLFIVRVVDTPDVTPAPTPQPTPAPTPAPAAAYEVQTYGISDMPLRISLNRQPKEVGEGFPMEWETPVPLYLVEVGTTITVELLTATDNMVVSEFGWVSEDGAVMMSYVSIDTTSTGYVLEILNLVGDWLGIPDWTINGNTATYTFGRVGRRYRFNASGRVTGGAGGIGSIITGASNRTALFQVVEAEALTTATPTPTPQPAPAPTPTPAPTPQPTPAPTPQPTPAPTPALVVTLPAPAGLATSERLVSVVPPAPVAGQDLRYTVQAGETVWSIGFNYYGSMQAPTVNRIIAANRGVIPASGALTAQTVITLPVQGLRDPIDRANAANAAGMYRVQSGDTLATIALHFYGNAAEWRRLHEANAGRIPNANRIYEGQWLIIP